MCLGVPGKIISITNAEDGLGIVDVAGIQREVNLACVMREPPDSLLGRWVVIHVGFALTLIDEAEAKASLSVLQAMAESGGDPYATNGD